MSEAESRDRWDTGHLYESYVGRWSRRTALIFVDWLNLPADSAWLDVGCGTGALSRTILDRAAPRSVFGIDPSAGYVDHARRAIVDPRIRFGVGDAQALEFGDGAVDVAVSGLVLNFVPGPARAAAEMIRVTSSGGVAAAYVWDYAGKMELIRAFWDAAVAEDPAATELDEGRRFPIADPDRLEATFRGAGLGQVESRAIDVPTVFRDFDDFWNPFLGGQGPAPTYAMSLPDEARARLRERLRRTLPVRADGSIALSARAWAVRGRRP